jgi:hypothetical protein
MDLLYIYSICILLLQILGNTITAIRYKWTYDSEYLTTLYIACSDRKCKPHRYPVSPTPVLPTSLCLPSSSHNTPSQSLSVPEALKQLTVHNFKLVKNFHSLSFIFYCLIARTSFLKLALVGDHRHLPHSSPTATCCLELPRGGELRTRVSQRHKHNSL